MGNTPGQAIPSSEGVPFFTFLNTASLRNGSHQLKWLRKGGAVGSSGSCPPRPCHWSTPLLLTIVRGIIIWFLVRWEIRKTSTSSDNSNAESAYRLGASLPFVSFSSSGPSTPVPSPQTPSFSDAITEDKSATQNRFRDLGRWISFHGGRQTFVRWLSDLLLQ